MEMKKAVQLLAGHSITAYISAILFGAPLFSMITETLIFSCLLSILVSLPCLWFCGTSYLHILDLFTSPKNHKNERSAKFIVLMTIFGSWIGSVVIPLDWEVWWQTWPISNCVVMILLSFFGWLLNLTLFKYYPALVPFAVKRKI